MPKVIRALPPLTPIEVTDIDGIHVPFTKLQSKLKALSSMVLHETVQLYNSVENELLEKLKDRETLTAPAEWARQQGYRIPIDTLPRYVLAKSRLEKLVQYKLVSETSAYVKNPQDNKQLHRFSTNINLGAVDRQMASMSLVKDELTLLMSCFDQQLLLTFRIPAYVIQQFPTKFTLPRIDYRNKSGLFEFVFSYVLTPPKRQSGQSIGIDLGIVDPYVAAVLNANGLVAAQYRTGNQLKAVGRKRERLIVNAKCVKQKMESRKAVELASPVLQVELERLNAKTTRMTKALAREIGAEVSSKLDKHYANIVKMEDLHWVSGTSDAKIGSSRWSRSTQAEAIESAGEKRGFKTVKVSAKDTSRNCCVCSNPIVYNSKTRTVRCTPCSTVLDRDFNAAVNIAKRKAYPTSKRLSGGTTPTRGTGSDTIGASKDNYRSLSP